MKSCDSPFIQHAAGEEHGSSLEQKVAKAAKGGRLASPLLPLLPSVKKRGARRL